MLLIILTIYCSTKIYSQCTTHEQYYYFANKIKTYHDFNKNAEALLECYEYFYNKKDYGYALFSLNYASYCLIINNNIFEAKEIVDRAFHEIEITNYHNKQLNTDLHYLYALIYYNIGNTELSLIYAEKYINLFNKFGNGTYPHHVIFQNLGYCSFIEGDYNKSIQYFKEAIRLSPAKSQAFRFILMGAICESYLELNDFKNAELYLNLEIENQEFFENKYDEIQLIKQLANYYLKINKLDSAQIYINDALKKKPLFHTQINLFQLQGKLSLAKNNNQAEYYFNKAITISRDSLKHNRYKTSQVYLNAAKSFGKYNQDSLAIEYLNNSIISVWDDYKKGNKLTNILNHRLVSEAMLYKSFLLAKQSKKIEAKEEFDSSIVVINYLLNSKITSWDSALSFSTKLKSDYSQLLLEAIRMQDFEFSFKISQSMHAILLKLKVNETEANKLFKVQPQKLDSINKIKIKISKKRTLILNTDSNQKKDSLEAIIFNDQRQLDSLIRIFESSNPTYYKLKYSSPKITSIQSIQKNNLSNSTALIEYFMGEDKLYTFIVSKNDLKVMTTEIDSTLLNQITILNTSMRSLKGDFITFSNSSSYLYNLLLKEALEYLGPKIDELYIIPDNEINYVPFEVLIKNVPPSAKNSRFDLLPYLVKDYSVSYHYSSALLNNDNTSLSDNISGFAPSFTSSFSNAENLESLLHNKEEVLVIKDITDGQINIDTAANLKNLKQSVNQYRIAHLATHATCNDTLPFESKIYLEDGPIHAYEIYNMPHKLDLAVLSACETGTGALKKGEGLMSLARAFISSGCKSVITSLWNVNDQKSVEIMGNFYTHLYQGKTVAKSLTLAKRNYLSDVNAVLDAHPYHWATFIIIGNADMAISIFQWEIALCILFIILIVILSYLFSQKKI